MSYNIPDSPETEPMNDVCPECDNYCDSDGVCQSCKEWCACKEIELQLRKTSQKELPDSIADYEKHEVAKIVVRLSHYHPNHSLIRIIALSGNEYTFQPQRDKNGK